MKDRPINNGSIKSANRLTVIRLIDELGTVSRAGIAEKIGMSKSSVSTIVEELINAGWIQEVGLGRSTGQGGKKPVLLQINGDSTNIIAVYFSYNLVEIGIADFHGNLMDMVSIDIDSTEDPFGLFDRIIENCRHLIEEWKLRNGQTRNVIGCGSVMKGLVDTEKGELSYSATLRGWQNVPIGKYFSEKLGIPTFVENDARAVTVHMLRKYKDLSPKVLMCVCVERGVGVGLAVEGQVYYGFNSGISTTHMMLDPNGPVCSCGNIGCWDVLTSIETLKNELVKKSPKYRTMSLGQVVMSYQNKDELVIDTEINYTEYWMKRGIVNALNCYNPDVMVLVGRYFNYFEGAAERIKEAVQNMPNSAAKRVKVIVSDRQEHLFLISAVSVVYSAFLSEKFHQTLVDGIDNAH